MEIGARPVYSSPTRVNQSRATRRTIVAAAGELFVENGYAATTIDAIAARAGVGRKTVFSSIGGKGALLKLVWDWALGGDDEPVPMVDRPAVQAMLLERDPRRLVRMWAEMIVDVGARAASVGAVVISAADVDDEAHQLLDTIRRESLVGATAFVTHLAGRGGLRAGISIEKGADTCWALVNSVLLHLLVADRGWSTEEFRDWLADVVTMTLLEPEGHSRVGPAPVRTVHDPARGRYEASVDGRPAGHLAYERTDHLVVLTRTEVEPSLEDRGVAEALVRRALEDARAEEARVAALCPFVSWWLDHHPDEAPCSPGRPALDGRG